MIRNSILPLKHKTKFLFYIRNNILKVHVSILIIDIDIE